jgi:hypothetical protein
VVDRLRPGRNALYVPFQDTCQDQDAAAAQLSSRHTVQKYLHHFIDIVHRGLFILAIELGSGCIPVISGRS